MPKFVVEASDASTGPKDLKNNAYYVGVQSSDLNPLDLVARQIMAYKFSGAHEQNPVRQAMRDIETVACAVVGTNTLLVAHNHGFGGKNLNEKVIEQAAEGALQTLRAEGFINIVRCQVLHPSKPQKKSFHAEMQIIEYCSQNNLPIQGAVIGVSKPCCGKCAKVLKVFGIDFSLYSVPPIGAWTGPDADRVPTSPRPAL